MREIYKGTSCTYIGNEPACTHCGGGTIKVDAEELAAQNTRFEKGEYKFSEYDSKNPEPPEWKPHPHPGFLQMLYWALSQPVCYRHILHLRNSYRKHAGVEVDMQI